MKILIATSEKYLFFIFLLFLASCSSHEESDLWGTWQSTIDFPQENIDEIQSGMPDGITVGVADINMNLTLRRDGQFSMTFNSDVSAIYHGVGVGFILSGYGYSVMQEISGSWTLIFDHILFTVEEQSVTPRDKSTADKFKKNPEYRRAWESNDQGEVLQWKIEEVNSDELVLSDQLYGKNRFKRFKR